MNFKGMGPEVEPKAQEKKPLEKLKELFAESTTGIDRLVVIENRCRFWIFCTVYIVFFVVTVISIGKTLQNHFEYRDIVSISMTEGNSLQLPAVTFCNLNPLRKSAVCSPNTLDMMNGTIRNILCDQDDPMDINMVHNFTTEELYPFLNVARKYNNSQTLLALGHTKQRMVLNCTVKGESCLDDSMYETTTNPTFGLCYCIFCSNFNASKISYQASNLPVDGLTLVLDIEKEEYLRSSSEMGMIVMVHRRGVSPDPNEDGMYLSPLMTTLHRHRNEDDGASSCSVQRPLRHQVASDVADVRRTRPDLFPADVLLSVLASSHP
ncbi:hypothetical protein MTO96_000879 [Rhipicephalus appendiculatus]